MKGGAVGLCLALALNFFFFFCFCFFFVLGIFWVRRDERGSVKEEEDFLKGLGRRLRRRTEFECRWLEEFILRAEGYEGLGFVGEVVLHVFLGHV